MKKNIFQTMLAGMIFFSFNVQALSNRDINTIATAVGGMGAFFMCSGLASDDAGQFLLGGGIISCGFIARGLMEKERSKGEAAARALTPLLGDAVEDIFGAAIQGGLFGGAAGLVIGSLSRIVSNNKPPQPGHYTTAQALMSENK